jgi:hypothetical protein
MWQPRRSCRMHASNEEPDWDAEMQMFRERTMRPNQLETLRKAEEQDVDLGQAWHGGLPHHHAAI